jgi:hypothetical protein
MEATKYIKELCPRPCETYQFNELQRIVFKNSSDQLSQFWIAYSDTGVPIHQEVLLYDFNAIIAAVGGSLGLFIGFSVFDTFKAIIQRIFNKYT